MERIRSKPGSWPLAVALLIALALASYFLGFHLAGRFCTLVVFVNCLWSLLKSGGASLAFGQLQFDRSVDAKAYWLGAVIFVGLTTFAFYNFIEVLLNPAAW